MALMSHVPCNMYQRARTASGVRSRKRRNISSHFIRILRLYASKHCSSDLTTIDAFEHLCAHRVCWAACRHRRWYQNHHGLALAIVLESTASIIVLVIWASCIDIGSLAVRIA